LEEKNAKDVLNNNEQHSQILNLLKNQVLPEQNLQK